MPALPHGWWLTCSLRAELESSLCRVAWGGGNLGLLRVMKIRWPQAGKGVQLLFVVSTRSVQDWTGHGSEQPSHSRSSWVEGRLRWPLGVPFHLNYDSITLLSLNVDKQSGTLLKSKAEKVKRLRLKATVLVWSLDTSSGKARGMSWCSGTVCNNTYLTHVSR